MRSAAENDSTAPADLDLLAALGLPLAGAARAGASSRQHLLGEHVRRAAREVVQGGDPPVAERRREALHALVLALAHHYPSRFEALLSGCPNVDVLLAREPSGRVIKLRRIAVRALAEVL